MKAEAKIIHNGMVPELATRFDFAAHLFKDDVFIL